MSVNNVSTHFQANRLIRTKESRELEGVERFQSRDQRPYWFAETKDVFLHKK